MIITPNLEDWLIAQPARDDDVGALARLWLSTVGDTSSDPVSFERWWAERKSGGIMAQGVATAEDEHAAAVADLQAGKSPATFLRAWASRQFQTRHKESSDHHRRHHEVTLESHLSTLQSELFSAMSSARIVYLDTAYWLGMRDVLRGIRPSEVYVSIHRKLEQLCAERAVICPLSTPLFHELMRQKDPSSREATARLLDQFSLGVGLRPPDEIIRTEIRCQIYRSIQHSAANESGGNVWCKGAFLLGKNRFDQTPLPEEQHTYIQKCYADSLWNMSVRDILDLLGDDEYPLHDNGTQAGAFNLDFRYYRNHTVARKEIRNQELAAIWHQRAFAAFREIAAEILSAEPDLCTEYLSRKSAEGQYDPKILPNLQIYAALSSFFAADHRKKVVASDVPDIDHVAFALPYSEIFACDRRIAHALRSGPDSIESKYDAKIIGSASELDEALDGLA